MLSIGKLGIGQERYYLDKVAEGAEEYYSGEGEAAGEWTGDAAEHLGLDGPVEADQLTAMLTGHNPVSGEPLLGRQGVPGKGPVPGFDLTFSAPKSVSLLWGLGGPVAALEVQAAHREAVAAALTYMQQNACWTRRGAGGAEFVKGNGYRAAAYRHRSSRNGDPQLHTHVLLANATQGPDGRWTRLYHPAIYDHATTASYIYEAHLRHELSRRLGVQWQRTRKGIAEIAGFADEHLRAFSTRRAEILEAAGPDASARSMQVATLATRKPKEQGVSREDIIERWRSRAEEIGLDREAVERTFDTTAGMRIAERTGTAAESPEVSFEELGLTVTASASHFDRRDAIQAVADSLPQGAPGAEVERMADAFLASDEVIRVAETQKGPRYTTQRIWKLEREALAAAERMKAQGPRPAGELAAARVIDARPTLKSDQREMVRRLLTERAGVTIVIGEAGTGKTYAIVAAAEGWAQAGIELRAAAPTWRAANVMRSEGLPAVSIASLLVELDRAEHDGGEGLPQGSVLLIDEAGMVDSATLARLVSHAEGKLVLVGDPEQLSEIEAGGLFRALADRSEPIYLDQVIRHEHELDRVAAKRIREGEGREALGLYESGERVTVAPQRRSTARGDGRRLAPLLRARRGRRDGRQAKRRGREVERNGKRGPQGGRGAGRAGGQSRRRTVRRWRSGHHPRQRPPSRDLYNRERWQVAEVDPAKGSIVLQGIDQPRRVEVGADYLTRINPYNDAPALEHAYAVTTYSAQGTTVDRAFVMADPSMDKQEFYVAASRSREETRLYATPEVQAHREEIAPQSPYLRQGIPHIAEAAERDRAQLAAHDIAQLQSLPTEELMRRRSELARPAAEEQRAEAKGLPAVERTARTELAAVESLLAERRQLAITAARISPPPYIRTELGERPSDPRKGEAWDRGVSQIERYRQEHGIKDNNRPFGQEAKSEIERARQQSAMQRLRDAQRAVGRGRQASRGRDPGHSIGIGR
jgi:conjugative relaxase-like TrwC/TraI family protein